MTMAVNNWNVGTQSNMLGAVYWINQLPLDLPTQTPSQNIPSAKWEQLVSPSLSGLDKLCANSLVLLPDTRCLKLQPSWV